MTKNIKTKKKTQVTIIGKVVSGKGEGKYYMGLSGYRRQFMSKLGIDSYQGTLNLKLTKANSEKLKEIKRNQGILIRGFKRGKKSFGEVIGYRAEVSSITCALIIPKLSTHVDVAEIISSKRLRRTLNLKDGSSVAITVEV